MERFTLTSTISVELDLEANICLRPSNPSIMDFIATYRTFNNENEAIENNQSFIEEMTPLLFTDFQSMENVDYDLRMNFYL